MFKKKRRQGLGSCHNVKKIKNGKSLDPQLAQ